MKISYNHINHLADNSATVKSMKYRRQLTRQGRQGVKRSANQLDDK